MLWDREPFSGEFCCFTKKVLLNLDYIMMKKYDKEIIGCYQ